MKRTNSKRKTVLVAVLKSRRDLAILLKKNWYRIPVFYLPKKKFDYVAFYQPAVFGAGGKRIQYYARAARKRIVKRIDLLPKEPGHPRAGEDYLKCEFSQIEKLAKPIKNIIPRRISFGFTNLKTLLSSRDILELYGVPKTEQIVERRLNRLGIKTKRELPVRIAGKRFRIDLAVIRGGDQMAIECDNLKAHSSKRQRVKDRAKDAYLRRGGWRVIRLKERDIIERLDRCVGRIQKALEVI